MRPTHFVVLSLLATHAFADEGPPPSRQEAVRLVLEKVDFGATRKVFRLTGKDRRCLAGVAVDQMGAPAVVAALSPAGGGEPDLGEVLQPMFGGLVDCGLTGRVLAGLLSLADVKLDRETRACVDRVAPDFKEGLTAALTGLEAEGELTEQAAGPWLGAMLACAPDGMLDGLQIEVD